MNRSKWSLGTLEVRPLEGSETGPLLVAAEDGATEPGSWLEDAAGELLSQVGRRGAVVVRGLDLRGPESFAAAVAALGVPLVEHYGDLPYRAVEGAGRPVFSTTPYPAEHAILFHNEGSHTVSAPRLLVFHCDQPATEGGETPLASSCAVLEQLSAETRRQFEERGLEYVRNFVVGLDVPWQRFFGTADPRAVDEICAAAGSRVEWDEAGGLRLSTPRPAVARHPESGRDAFYNQVLLHHPASLEEETREALRASYPESGFPRNVLFGDGAAIPDEMIEEVLDAHLEVAFCFPWRAGDLALVDNLAVAHARRPFVGSRTHHVALSGLDGFP